jgi:hypothetical protein
MGKMDELLAQLKAEYAQPEQPSTLPPRSQEQSKPQTTEPIDDLLAEVKAEFEGEQTKLEQGREVRSLRSRCAHSTLNPKNSSFSKDLSNSDNLIKDLQQEDKAEQERKQQEIIAQKQKQQDKERRRTEALKQKAREWLNNLDPKSDEGLWFEEFAYAYESKLEAAIDYLKAIRESHFLG